MLSFFYLFLAVFVTCQVNGKWNPFSREELKIWNSAKSNSWPSKGAPDVKEDDLEELPSYVCAGAPDIKCDGKTCIMTCPLYKRAARLTCNTYIVWVANGKFWAQCWNNPKPKTCWPNCPRN